jgi:uncharacterized lipoprotein YmbA
VNSESTQLYRTSAFVGLLLIVNACGSSPPVRYYSLEAIDARYEGEVEVVAGLGIGPLRMPEYLGKTRIVTRRGDAEMVVDDFNRWAEPVEDEVHRIVATNLDGLLDDTVVVAFPYRHYTDLRGQVVGRVDRFDADQDGQVVLLVQWGIVTSDSDFIVAPRRVRYDARASEAGDYTAVASAMSQTLADFSRDIAREYRTAFPRAD